MVMEIYRPSFVKSETVQVCQNKVYFQHSSPMTKQSPKLQEIECGVQAKYLSEFHCTFSHVLKKTSNPR